MGSRDIVSAESTPTQDQPHGRPVRARVHLRYNRLCRAQRARVWRLNAGRRTSCPARARVGWRAALFFVRSLCCHLRLTRGSLCVYGADLLKNIRTEVLIRLIKPYTCIRIPFISKQLNIEADEVEALLVSCVLDGLVNRPCAACKQYRPGGFSPSLPLSLSLSLSAPAPPRAPPPVPRRRYHAHTLAQTLTRHRLYARLVWHAGKRKDRFRTN